MAMSSAPTRMAAMVATNSCTGAANATPSVPTKDFRPLHLGRQFYADKQQPDAGANDYAGRDGITQNRMVNPSICAKRVNDPPILNHLSPAHAISAMPALVMIGLAVVGLYYRPRQRILRKAG